VDQAVLRAHARTSDRPADRPLLSEAAVAIGYRYPSMHDDSRLPHRWLAGSSTLDLVRDGRYLLLTGADGRGWPRATPIPREPFSTWHTCRTGPITAASGKPAPCWSGPTT
jgi:hypothetical protein